MPNSDSHDNDSIQSIRDYKLLAELGHGLTGTVYRAVHTRLEMVVAIKILRRTAASDRDSLRRFHQEMKAIGKLSHINIVRAHDAGEADGRHFLVMEYVDGLDLESVVRRMGALPVAAACEIARQMAVGLQHAYSQGLVHRDVKPANVMLTPNGVVKVLDFGLARLKGPKDQTLTLDHGIVGTIDYIAPEQAVNSRDVDIRADIYGLGATLYKMLCGSAPFEDDESTNPLKRLLAISQGQPRHVRDACAEIADELAAVVMRLLEKNPQDRFSTPEEVELALRSFAEGADLPLLYASLPSEAPDPPGKPTTDLGRQGETTDAGLGVNVVPKSTPKSPSSEEFDQAVVRVPVFHIGGVVGPEFFVGRKDELSRAESIVRQNQSLLVIGDFRDGKTSFCRMLIHRLKTQQQPSILPVYMNVQFWPNLTLETFLEHTIIGIIGEIAREVFGCKYTELPAVAARPSTAESDLLALAIINTLVRERTFSQREHVPHPFTTDDFTQYHNELMTLIRNKGWNNCVVFYDEANKLPETLSLERLLAHNDAVAMSGGASVYVASRSMVNSYFELKLHLPYTIEVGPFRAMDDMLQLLSRYYFGDARATDRLPVETDAYHLIWTHAKGRPFLIQMIAHRSFDHAHGRRSHIVESADVHESLATLRQERPELFPENQRSLA